MNVYSVSSSFAQPLGSNVADKYIQAGVGALVMDKRYGAGRAQVEIELDLSRRLPQVVLLSRMMMRSMKRMLTMMT
jgi:hypothetical protein